jgi:hypothetical protein
MVLPFSLPLSNVFGIDLYLIKHTNNNLFERYIKIRGKISSGKACFASLRLKLLLLKSNEI